MDETGRRRHERKESLNIIDYTVLDDNGEPVTRRMGRTLNVSEGGMLLETHIPLKMKQEVLITVALEEDLVDVRGTVVHACVGAEKGFFCSGIQFSKIPDEGLSTLKKYIEAIKAEED